VVDNSGSMGDEQQNLATSFPGFIGSIQNTVMAKDYHIMVIDTDAGNSFLQECFALCAFFPDCEGYPCNNLPRPRAATPSSAPASSRTPRTRPAASPATSATWSTASRTSASTFQCLAKVGTDGDGSERPMEAMISSVSALNDPGQCNDGFLRNDALLVVTFITDEEDDGQVQRQPRSAGTPASSPPRRAPRTSIVVLGLIGDPDQPNPVCTDGAEASPRLRTFAESFTYGSWGSICSPRLRPVLRRGRQRHRHRLPAVRAADG
jgi:hypothetical protein